MQARANNWLYQQLIPAVTVWFWLAPAIVIPYQEGLLVRPLLWSGLVGACCLAGMLGWKRYFIMGIAGILLLSQIYPEANQFLELSGWWQGKLGQDLLLAQIGEWHLVSPVARALLYFLGVVLAIDLSRWLLRTSGSIWLLWILGIFMLLSWANAGGQSFWLVVVYTIVGLILQMVWTTQLLIKEQAHFPGRRWFGVATAGILLLVMTAIYLPQPAVSWELPPWFPAAPVRLIQDKPGKAGYGANDLFLGGPFETEGEILLEIKSPVAAYWRGEAKEVYTGNGWVSRERMVSTLAPGELLLSGDEFALVEQEVVVRQHGFSVAVGMQTIQGFSATGGRRIVYTPMDRFSLGKMPAGFQYRVLSVPAGKMAESGIAYQKLPFEIRKQYLELPVNLPARVRELTEQITRRFRSPYEKAKAIETFLRERYRYQVVDLPPVDPNRDFVDQFLYESQQGYCDYFSTAMAVMARTVGIPARWVKGFTPGEITGPDSDGKFTFIVRDYNAHSWAEVFIAGLGWVSLEATAGFAVPTVDGSDTNTALVDEQDLELVAVDDSALDNNGLLLSAKYNWVSVLGWGMLILIGILSFRWLMPRLLPVLIRWLSGTVWGTSIIIQLVLLTARLAGKPRKPWETLREFSSRWAIPGLFTVIFSYERRRYRG